MIELFHSNVDTIPLVLNHWKRLHLQTTFFNKIHFFSYLLTLKWHKSSEFYTSKVTSFKHFPIYTETFELTLVIYSKCLLIIDWRNQIKIRKAADDDENDSPFTMAILWAILCALK
jgi:hypothetical protein